MISSRSDLQHYLEQDRIADEHKGRKPKVIGGWPNLIWKYKIFLRKAEFYTNCGKGISGKLLKIYYKYRYTCLGIKLGYTIPLNVIGPGLSLPHYGTVIINGTAKIGKNCRIMADVCIGSTSGINQAAHIGDNVYIGAGAKILGDIKIGNDVCVGANAVVTKNFENGVTIAGIPAKVISHDKSHKNISPNLLKDLGEKCEE